MNARAEAMVMFSSCLILLFAVAAYAQPSGKDKEFVEKAAVAGMAEVETGKLAQQKSQAADVKDFAAMMVSDHSKAGEELKTLAQKKGIAVPAKLDKDHQELVNKLQKKSGKDFDEAYSEAMKDGHEDVVAMFEKAQKSDDADIKAYATKTLPTLRAHLDHAKQLADKHD